MPKGKEGAEPNYIPLGRIARRFGVSAGHFARLADAHPLYAPAIKGIPGADPATRIGQRTRLWHSDQLRIIEGVLVGTLDIETGWAEWQAIRARIGLKPQGIRGKAPRKEGK